MKIARTILVAATTALASLSTVSFFACTKVKCSDIVCKNGGACTDGVCSCPSGFAGTFCESVAITAIVYQNNTFTPVAISINGVNAVIPVGGSSAFTGKFGDVAIGTATTSGSAKSLGISTPGGVIGLPINWSFDHTFPANDTLRVPLDIGATYFFLRLHNTTGKNILDYYVNYAFPYGETYEDVTVPSDGNTYDLGYYLAYPNSNVQVQTSASKVIWNAITLPFTNNQVATITVK